ncbi:MAG: 4-(cytidine 5'-diphospho)-2-C-methyl-D-erythritol kinase [Brevundimonas sp.]|uniref:4-(cytidine 5'-diphospho)-2-C-methyl-D-erythritol kinase n=1 Tax=Brevundimonas sp. TaxID=1871086 RepID=UPI00272022CD|nr:4-(cytidine 5'-diphospho)-2-C-methyl-D-erythritol kinase [Brevundimonas sp.]MDO9586458.1 4-(cytidine 5'-diphospho)-2-C-methyl-D-erythritol kinase [Brevundimonas sp.]MDP3370554.1 4-(cytidine 5'-diphospho)-2-C-methyl-D-erythritol kinase [Brevundimonas sp.]
MPPVTRLAPAKVNLFLHVGPVDADGYHPLASLVAFADVGDQVTVERAERLSLTVTGPFARALEGEGDNLVLRAVRALGAAAGIGEPGLGITLDKQLPVAAGLGGGSSDAGAALKLARDALGLPFDDVALAEISAGLGADGPMCLHARAAWAEGRGGVLTFETGLPPLPALLVNPGAPSSTGAVYRAFDAGSPGRADRPPPPSNWRVSTVIDWLATRRNDLQAPAVARTPAIGEAMAAAVGLPGARLTRMSGSGATVFALFDTAAAAGAAGQVLSALHPGWWVRPTVLR